ncbi:TIGR04283 family arsenosugar biosynthesis glycosyltransferase [Crenalkalicoccus roseus]|uniref:TIGR04283 family arsenosugar biosynthesis glycosyltransferase n=1 Tax=Crenalkalicoccus roseus TaxID=1485588 RepID=UPI0010810223|nr:TIGR04283 family arsenosugar biosynthesis glycosyltransferase [Crenalkalicoccus roseus]
MVKATLEQTLSIVLPTLNAAQCLGPTLAACAEAGAELVVADGGSRDRTAEVAIAAGARLIRSPPGRGVQLAAGAAAARGAWLLFLHADTRPAPGWAAAARAFMAEPANAGRAAHFAFALDDPSPQARRLERRVAWRCRVLGLPYGDQGLLLSRALYEQVGGYRPLPLMEDVDLVRRLGRRRLAALPVAATTSAERWRREGWRRRSARNLLCLSLWFLGVPPGLIRRVYG